MKTLTHAGRTWQIQSISDNKLIAVPWDLPKALMAERTRLGLTQTEMAVRLNVKQPYLARLEKGLLVKALPDVLAKAKRLK